MMSRQIAALVRRFPFILRLPYQIFSRVQASYTVGVAAVVFDDRGRVLLVDHAYHPRFSWGLPGGWIDVDEDPADGILRELDEELQLEAEVISVVHVRKTAPKHIDLAFHCEARSPVGTLSHELLDYEWVDQEQIPALKRFHHRAIEAAYREHRRRAEWVPA